MTDHLDSALYKLGFGAGRMDSMSTDLSPEECAALLKRIESSVEVVVEEEEEAT